MENDLNILKEQSQDEELYDLGQWIGRKQAFGLISGKTAAADIECLRQIRERKLFRAKGVDWSGFCQQYAGITRSYADRLIRQLEDFGPNYFHLSQIVRISPHDYRQIAPAISDEGIAFGEEKVPISPENSQRLVEAVNALKSAFPAKPVEKGVAVARKRLESSIAAMNQVIAAGLNEAERAELAQAVSAGLMDLNLLSLTLRPS
jgi:hypothetical protein